MTRLTYPLQAHAGCSEPFYERTILAEVQSGDGPSSVEKKEMLRIIQEMAKTQDELTDDQDGDAGLAAKLEGVNLGTAGPHFVWPHK
jgi:hypothetical protein